MTMNKKEIALLESLKQQLSEALAQTTQYEEIKPDLPPPTYKDPLGTLSKGWQYNTYSKCVEKMCSSSVNHGHGWEKTTSQKPRNLYSTELLAYKAMRNDLAAEYNKELAKIDNVIKKLEEL